MSDVDPSQAPDAVEPRAGGGLVAIGTVLAYKTVRTAYARDVGAARYVATAESKEV
jgi:hypothetical protein